MLARLTRSVGRKIVTWLTREKENRRTPLCDFERLCYEVRPGDVLLVEGTSHVSEVIKIITQSNWTHSALYIGRLYDIEDRSLREYVKQFYDGDPNEQLLVEALLGEGTIVVPMSKYEFDHLRICRPKGLSPCDANQVSEYTIRQLGKKYDLRQLLDLARFLFPWAVMPRRWRSSLFEHNAGESTRTVCSCLIAEAFTEVQFPILPFVGRDEDGKIRLFKRNPKLFTPKDFDYSPYFDIIKYPYLGLEDLGLYRKLPWSEDDVIYNDEKKAAFASAMAAQEDEGEPELNGDTEPAPADAMARSPGRVREAMDAVQTITAAVNILKRGDPA